MSIGQAFGSATSGTEHMFSSADITPDPRPEALLEIPNAAIPYIGLQWPGAAKKADIPNPESQMDALESATPEQVKTISDFYLSNLAKDWRSVQDHIPATARAVLDIGCGAAGIDALIHRHLRKDGQGPKLHLLDKSEVSEDLTYGFKGRNRFYASLDVAQGLLTANGVPAEQITRHEVGPTLPWCEDVDLVISLHSWGFHYPLAAYVEYVRAILANGGVGITDIRRDKESALLLRLAFRNIEVIQEHSNRQRVKFWDAR